MHIRSRGRILHGKFISDLPDAYDFSMREYEGARVVVTISKDDGAKYRERQNLYKKWIRDIAVASSNDIKSVESSVKEIIGLQEISSSEWTGDEFDSALKYLQALGQAYGIMLEYEEKYGRKGL